MLTPGTKRKQKLRCILTVAMWIAATKGSFATNDILLILFCWMHKVKEISTLLSLKDILIK